jgi:hypothetical protein
VIGESPIDVDVVSDLAMKAFLTSRPHPTFPLEGGRTSTHGTQREKGWLLGPQGTPARSRDGSAHDSEFGAGDPGDSPMGRPRPTAFPHTDCEIGDSSRSRIHRSSHATPTATRMTTATHPIRIHRARAASALSSARRLLDRNGSDPPVSIRIGFAISLPLIGRLFRGRHPDTIHRGFAPASSPFRGKRPQLAATSCRTRGQPV